MIKSAKFIKSIADIRSYREFSLAGSAPEICVVGRSNVGKSSFINFLTRRKKLAKTSSTPGRTRLINLFDIDEGRFVLVDLPGYGYARVSRGEKEKWDALLGGYLETSDRLLHAFVLVDSRIAPTELDILMIKYLYFYQIPFTVFATKCDKLSGAQRAVSVQKIASALGLGKDDIIPVSAVSRESEQAALRRLEEILSGQSQ